MNKVILIGLGILLFLIGCGEQPEVGAGSETVIVNDNDSLEQCKENLDAVYAAYENSNSRNLELGKELELCRSSKSRNYHHHRSSSVSQSSEETPEVCPEAEDCSELTEENQNLRDQIEELQAQIQNLNDQISSCQEDFSECQDKEGDNAEEKDCKKGKGLDPQPDHGKDDQHGHKGE